MKFRVVFVLTLSLLSTITFGQSGQSNQIVGQDTLQNPIATAVPFLTIGPDSRSAAMGDAGVAISPDANASYWNKAKLAFLDQEMGASMAFSPWLKGLDSDIYLFYLTGFKSLKKGQVISASLRYFDLGNMQFTDDRGEILQNFNPREFAFSAAYAMKLSDMMGLGIAGRFIHSNLSGSINNSPTSNTRPGNSVAVDVSWFYTNDELELGGYKSTLNFGADISNIGFKMTYSNQQQKDFIPTNLRVGTAWTTEFDAYNKLTATVDFNKLMVPTPTVDEFGARDNPSLISGILGSFGDAPGGFSEEIKEFTYSVGVEYWYNDMFAARGGYFHEAAAKGNRKYFTLGLGLRYRKLGFDFSYLVPSIQNHPLEGTMRFSIILRVDDATNTSSGKPSGLGDDI